MKLFDFLQKGKSSEPDKDKLFSLYKEVEAVTRIGTWELDLKTDVLWWSDEVYQLFGKEKAHFTPTYASFLELIHPADRERLESAFEYSVKNNRPYEVKHRLLFANGDVKYVIERGRTFYNKQGEPERAVGTVLDVTEIENLEMQVRLVRNMEALGKLAGGIAHDFNNLLGVIIGYTGLLLEKTEKGSDLQSDVKEILKAARKSSEITSQLLSFSRNNVIDPVVINVNQRVVNLQNLIQQLAKDSIRVMFDLADDTSNISIGMAEFDQILINLISNAADAMPQGGRITIRTRAFQGADGAPWNQLEVEDTGEGIAPENREKIFEPFFSTKPPCESTGLGLSTVFTIVQKNRGIIDVRSVPGEGTTFLIDFPVCADCGLFNSCDDCTYDDNASAERASFNGITVMLVDDDEMMRNLLENMIRAIGCKVVACASPEQAMRYFRQHPGSVDVLVVDVVMPDSSGPDLVHALKAIREGVHVLYISGYTEAMVNAHGVHVDSDHFLAKPFSMEDLRKKLLHFVEIEHALVE